MSNLQRKYPLDHRVFSGGRYLRAFDHLADIDHYEHSILTYLGSLMPFDKGFVDTPAFPSIATIARATKISEATVRDRTRSLEKKGYLRVDAVRFVNPQGKFQQSSNDYYLSSLAFGVLDDVLASREYIGKVRKRVAGDNVPEQLSPCAVGIPSPSPGEVVPLSAETRPLPRLVPKSPLESPKDQITAASNSSSREPAVFTRRAEVDRITEAWEEVVGISVSPSEKLRFMQEYVRSRADEIYFMERIAVLAGDAYLVSRAKSVNFLFKGFDFAVKNRAEIRQIAGRALGRAQTPVELQAILKELPGLVAAKSQNFGNSSDAVVCQLFQDSVISAHKRLELAPQRSLPKNEVELTAAINRNLNSGMSEKSKERLRTVLLAIPHCNFLMCLNLYSKYLKAAEGEQS